MTFRFTEGCDSYAASADLAKKWLVTTGAAWSSSAGRNGGGAIQLVGSAATVISQNIFTSNICNLCFWWKASQAPGALWAPINWLDINGNTLNQLRINNGTTTFFMVNNSGTGQNMTSSINVCDNNWHWIEFQFNSTTGTSLNKCWIDGVLAYNSNGVSMNTGTIARLYISGGTSVTWTLDDIVIFDNTGASPITSDMPVGPQQINTQRPNGDSAIQFVPDTGATNYTQINEVNGDTTHYVQSGNSGDQDLYDYDDMLFSPARILGVMANIYAHNPGVGSINHNQVCKNGSTTTTGTTTAMPITNPRVVQEPFVLDPNTGAAWASAAALNAAKFGIKVT